MMAWKNTTLAGVLAALTAMGGCTLIPDQDTPSSPVPEQLGANLGDEDTPVRLPGWRSLFPNPELQLLIQTALTSNRDLRLAILNVAEARAQYQIEGADLFPTISADAEGSRQSLPADLSQTGQSTIQTEYSVGLVASYEVDLFGRVRSLEQAALEDYLGTESARRTAQITLVSELDLRQAQVALETARANRAQFQRRVAEDRTALALVVGAPLPPLIGDDLRDPQVATLAEVPEGLPSSVLRLRPDILEAEYNLRAANANIGAARAAFFPSISLTGAAGTASSELDGLFESGSDFWSFSPSISLPIFSGGRNRANLDVAEVRRDQNVARYEQTVQTAFKEVSDALAGRATLIEQEASQSRLVDATARSLELAEARYREGADDYLAVLDARRELLTARQELVSLKLQKLGNRVTLYRALGGGEFANQPVLVTERESP